MIDDLLDFLLARIAEDEKAARDVEKASPGAWAALPVGLLGLARHDPARVLAECDAKRRMLGLLDEYSEQPPHLPRLTIYTRYIIPKILALPYADHPDYRDEWKP